MNNDSVSASGGGRKGRRRVRGSEGVSDFRYQVEGMRLLEGWVLSSELLGLFGRGKLRVDLGERVLRVGYVLPGGGVRLGVRVGLKFRDRRAWDEAKGVLQDFLLGCFYFYEWGGGEMSLRELGVILGVSKQAVCKECKGIFGKFKKSELWGKL